MLSLFVKEITDINWSHAAVVQALISVTFMPLFWNCAGRFEYYTKFLSTLLRDRYRGVYLLAAVIFCGSAFRDHLFQVAISSHPASDILSSISYVLDPLAISLIGTGSTFVLSSMWKLGIVGTYLGDYFGILMTSRVESFPFNVLADPMYMGSTMIFCGYSLLAKSWVGLICTIWVYFCYRIAILFEGPFTAMIYQRAATKQS